MSEAIIELYSYVSQHNLTGWLLHRSMILTTIRYKFITLWT